MEKCPQTMEKFPPPSRSNTARFVITPLVATKKRRKHHQSREMLPLLQSSVSLLLFVFVLLSNVDPNGAVTIDEVFQNAQSTLPQVPPDITMGVYYYPWHADDFHRGDGYVRRELQPYAHAPALGEYDDRRPEVISQHLAYSRRANVRVWMSSWWGPGSREDSTLLQAVLVHPELNTPSNNHRIAIMYEITGRGLKASAGWSPANVYGDLEYLCQNYFDHPAYYRIQGRPVITVYLTRRLQLEGPLLQEVLQLMRTAARATCQEELYIIGDQQWQFPDETQDTTVYNPDTGLNAVTNYDVYGNIGRTPYAEQDGIDRHIREAKAWKEFTARFGVALVPGVSPGYNDRGVRLQNDNRAASRKLDANSEHGTFFAAQLTEMRLLTDATADHFMLVNSFNEWHEDSQIEPVVGDGVSTEPTILTNGIEYEPYEDKYLQILRRATCVNGAVCPPLDDWKSLLLKPDPFETDPPPNQMTVGALYYLQQQQESSAWFRSRLTTRQRPVVGPYSDISSELVDRHVVQSRRAGIGLWVIPWNGVPDESTTLLERHVLSRTNAGFDSDNMVQVALLYQARNRIVQSTWDMSDVARDIQYLCQNYVDNPLYYTVGSNDADDLRPVVFVALTRWFNDRGRLIQLINTIRSASNQYCSTPIFLVGDQVWGPSPIAPADYTPFDVLDAVINIDIFGNLWQRGMVEESTLDTFYLKQQRNWRDAAWSRGCAYVPSIMPGFNNLGFGGTLEPLSRQLQDRPDELGSFFTASLDRARYLVDSTLGNLVVVATFNRFDEDTQIEQVAGKSSNLPIELTRNWTYHGYQGLYLDLLKNGTADSELPMPLLDEYDYFYQLRCNVGLPLSPTLETCMAKWTDLLGEVNTFNELVVVPCGQCVVLDYTAMDGPSTSSIVEVNLLGGLDVQGTLLIVADSERDLVVRTPFFRVQGALKVDSSGRTKVGQTPAISWIMTDQVIKLGSEKFIPAGDNAYACGLGRCEPAPSSIFVAGGAVNITGFSSNTLLRVPVVDRVATATAPVVQDVIAPVGCDQLHLIHESFDTASHVPLGTVRPNLGTHVTITDSTWVVANRSTAYAGIRIDLKDVRECLSMDYPHVLQVKFRLLHKELEYMPAPCSTNGNGCLEIYIDYLDASLSDYSSLWKLAGPNGSGLRYGEWSEIKAAVALTQAETNPENAFVSLRISGSGSFSELLGEIDLEFDDLRLLGAPDRVCSAATFDDCRNLVWCNGGADYDESFGGFVGASIGYDSNEANSFWRLTAGGASMQWPLPVGCLVESAAYSWSLRIKSISTPASQSLSVHLEAIKADGRVTVISVAECSTSSPGIWEVCTATFIVQADLLDNLDGVTMHVMSPDGSPDIEIDDLSFAYSHMQELVTKLIIEDPSIEDKWEIGVEISIGVPDTKPYDVRSIVAFLPLEDNNVILQLNSPIAWRTGLEILILNRNIRFESQNRGSDGGRLNIFRTPNVVQQVRGVEFLRFGSGGDDLGPKPIEFANSKDVDGSVISNNCIRESRSGCVALVETTGVSLTNNLLIGDLGVTNCDVNRHDDEIVIRRRRNLMEQDNWDNEHNLVGITNNTTFNRIKKRMKEFLDYAS